MTDGTRRNIRFLSGFMAVWIVVSVVVVWPVWHYLSQLEHQRVSIEIEAKQIQQSIDRLRQDRLILNQDVEIIGLWKASTPMEAATLVQARISSLAKEHGVSIRSISPLPDTVLPIYSSVAFRFEAEATLDKLTAFLVAAEFQTPALFMERGSIRRVVRPGPAPEQPLLFLQLEALAIFDIEET